MTFRYVDTHPHIVSNDEDRYPVTPLFGRRSAWSKERPATVEALIEQMDAAGVSKAAVVQSSTTYGFDNSYVVDACARYPDRLVAVGSVDVLLPEAPDVIRAWVRKGLAGLRVFTGGSTKAVDASELADPRVDPAWSLCAEFALPMCIQTAAVGLPEVVKLASRHPAVPIILDHMTRPTLSDGPPYAAAQDLFALAKIPSIYLKLTPQVFADARTGAATPASFFTRLIAEFGANRLVWGSNYPNSKGTLGAIRADADAALAAVSEQDRAWIFQCTAEALYPALVSQNAVARR